MQSLKCATQKELPELVKFLKVIGDENRIKILCLLGGGERCVCEIWTTLGIPQNLASHHLKTLKDAELISSKQDGRNIIYSINKKIVQNHSNLLNKILCKK